MLNSKEISIFVEGVERYFHQFNRKAADEDTVVIGTPFVLSKKDDVTLRYNGMISVSGKSEGVVIFSAGAVLLKYILLTLYEPTVNEALLNDLVGEIANTIAGNARRGLGSEFHISPPKVFRMDEAFKPSSHYDRSFVIPIQWRQNAARLIVGLSK